MSSSVTMGLVMWTDVARPRGTGWAYEMARNVREAFGVTGVPTDDDLWRILDALRVEVVEEEIPCGLKELLSSDLLVLHPALLRDERRWDIGHAIGHLLAHAGSQIELSKILRERQERQADIFAGWLLIGLACLENSESIFDVAELAGVPAERVAQWIGWLAA